MSSNYMRMISNTPSFYHHVAQNDKAIITTIHNTAAALCSRLAEQTVDVYEVLTDVERFVRYLPIQRILISGHEGTKIIDAVMISATWEDIIGDVRASKDDQEIRQALLNYMTDAAGEAYADEMPDDGTLHYNSLFYGEDARYEELRDRSII